MMECRREQIPKYLQIALKSLALIKPVIGLGLP